MQFTIEDYIHIQKCYHPHRASAKQINYIQELRNGAGKEEELRDALNMIESHECIKIEMIHDQSFTVAMAAFIIKLLSGGH
jgi:hypothetical protein